jgi:hypothetical protein
MQKQMNVCPYVFAKIKRRPKENQSLSVPQTCQKGKHGLVARLSQSERIKAKAAAPNSPKAAFVNAWVGATFVVAAMYMRQVFKTRPR